MSHILILNQSAQAMALLEDYQSCEWTRAFMAGSRFSLTISRHSPDVDKLAKGRLVVPQDEDQTVYLLEQIESSIDEKGRISDLIKITGRGIDGIFADRLIVPPGGSSHDSQTGIVAETAMKHYVTDHAGPGAAASRQIPNLVVIASSGRGSAVTVKGRYQTLLDMLTEIGQLATMGWEVTLDTSTADLEFDVVPGVDRSASVFFDVLFDTALAQRWLTSDLDRKTVAVVAGQGSGAARTVVTRWLDASEPTGFSRRETFVDARDLDTTAALEARGDSKLKEMQSADRFETDINPDGSFKYRTHWNLGDIITMRNTVWNIEQAARIVTVTNVVTPSSRVPDVSVELDRPWPTLKEKVVGSQPLSGSSRD